MHIHQLIRNGVLNLVGWCASFASGIATWAIMARSLGPEALGLYGYAAWLGATFTALATLGLPFTSEKFVAEHLGRGDVDGAGVICRTLLRTQAIIALLMCLAAAAIMAYFRPIQQPIIAAIVIASIAPSAIQIALRSFLSGFQRYALINVVAVLSATLQLGLVICAAILHGGVTLLLLANLLATIFSLILFSYAMRHALIAVQGGGSNLYEGSSSRTLWRFSLTFSYVSLLEYILWDKSEIFFLRRYSTYADLAFYSIAFAVSAKLVAVAQSFADLMLPLSSHAYGRSSTSGLAVVFFQSSRLMILVLVPLSAAAILIAEPAVTMLYGPRFSFVVLPLRILVAGIPIASLSAVGWAVITAAGREKILVKGITAGALLNIIGDYFLIRNYGAFGAAVATTIAQWFIAILLMWFSMRLTGSLIPWRTIIRAYMAAALAMCPAALLLSKPLPLMIATTVGLCLYPLVLLALREIRKKDISATIASLKLPATAN